jgi:hypothetical protein
MEKANAAPVMGTDRDCNIISRESGQTSIRSFFTREFTELLKEENANERETVCIPRHCNVLGSHRLAESTCVCQKAASAYRKGSERRPLQQGEIATMAADTFVLRQSLGSEASDK